MAALMKQKSFLRSSEGAIASYDFVDFAQGVGFKKFYLSDGYLVGTRTYFLTQNQDFSNAVSTGGGSDEANDLSFDLEFNRNITLKGVLNFVIAYKHYSTSGGSNTMTVKVYKVSTATTQIGSTSTLTHTFTGDSNWYWTKFVGQVDMPTTVFKNGDSIRIRVETTAGGVNRRLALYHSPISETDTFPPGEVGNTIQTTSSLVNIPFKIDS